MKWRSAKGALTHGLAAGQTSFERSFTVNRRTFLYGLSGSIAAAQLASLGAAPAQGAVDRDRINRVIEGACGWISNTQSRLGNWSANNGQYPTAMTALAGMAGNLCGGWWGDRSVARHGLRWGRRVTGLVSSGLAALIYLAAQWTDNLWLFVGEMIAISFLADLVLGSVWAIFQDIGGANTAVVLGFANMWGNLAAAGYGWLIGLLAEHKQWNAVFAVSSIGFCISAACWLAIDATRPVKGAGS